MSEFLAQPAGILLLVFGGIALGKLLAWAVLRGRIDAARLEGRAAAEPELAALRASLSETREQLAAESARGARLPEIERTLDRERQSVLAAEQKLGAAQAASEAELARIRAQLEAEREASRQKLALLDEAKAQLTEQFRNLATEILEDKSRRFTEQNQQNLGQLLDPLRMRIAEFQQKVETAYDTEGKERAALGERLSQLMALNQQISKEANDLTRALKGSTKAQGGWGEMLLESLLETAGLVRGQQYEVQAHHQREDGSRAQPDVVIRMPEDRRLVVDAKVSLLAYEQYASAEDESAREEALARHLDSVRSHVKGLAARDYQELHGEGSPDFVLMFVALEPAFMLAVTHDRGLFQFAWERNVLLVSPSTLLFVLRTVALLWRSDAQNRNALAIAREGAELYDKLAGFAEAIEKLGDRLRMAQEELDHARSRLTGKGGALRRAERLRELGAAPKKSMPTGIRQLLGEDVADEPDEH